jgi:protein O-GlcNAc transferase
VRIHRYAEARDVLEALIAEYGEQLNYLCNLTNALLSLGLQDDGLAVGRRTTVLWPEQQIAWRTFANALSYHPTVTGAALLDACRQAGQRLPRGTLPPPANASDADRRLRIGLLSPTLKMHPVGWLTVAGFETLDPAAFAVVCLGQGESADAVHRRFRRAAAEYHVVDGDQPAALAARIRALEIDVLIDLGGYGDRSMIAACAYRPAPVQVKWVGMQNHSTGLDAMDWFVTDRWATPPALRQYYSERLLTLPDGYVCYSPPPYAPDVGKLPALGAGRITFGCFNNTAKLNPPVIAAWSAILRRAADARLVLKAHAFADAATRARFVEAFARNGIAADRIDCRPGSSHRNLLAQYNDIDIALDPFPYNGGLTTIEALWMGVPTVTLPGETFSSRHSTSHLSNAGLADWVAADPDAYCAIALRWARDPAGLARLRAGLREQVRASPLCDAPRFGRNLGAALRMVWQDWCDRQQATRRSAAA